jgi:NTP pyrophosphatase (non-canonical NTP hydrolase)
MENDYLKIINHFGVNNQQRKLQEEVFELQEAITKYEAGIGDKEAIKEELADVLLILKQLKWFYQLSPLNVLLMARKKRKRTLKRMKEGYYEANTR